MTTQSRKHWLAVSLLVIAILFSEVYSFFVAPSRELTQDDGLAKWEQRMKPVREQLPSFVREVGYISDSDPTAINDEYALTQFALAPVVVRRGVEYEWIIGNFTQRGFEDILQQNIPTDFTITKFGAGIYLIHRTLP